MSLLQPDIKPSITAYIMQKVLDVHILTANVLKLDCFYFVCSSSMRRWRRRYLAGVALRTAEVS